MIILLHVCFFSFARRNFFLSFALALSLMWQVKWKAAELILSPLPDSVSFLYLNWFFAFLFSIAYVSHSQEETIMRKFQGNPQKSF